MKLRILVFTFITFLLISCSGNKESGYVYQLPQNHSDGLKTASLADAAVNEQCISDMTTAIRKDEYTGVHSVLIYKDNNLVLEEYFPGHRFDYEKQNHHGEVVNWSTDSIHRVMSVTKSITSICVGIAIQKGFIKSVNESIFEYLPEYKQLAKDGREKITIENLLTMTSGLDGNEWMMPYANPENSIIKIYFSEQPIQDILSLEQKFDPGYAFQYFGGSNFLLSAIIMNSTGKNLAEFADQYLFEPLGIQHYDWLKINRGIVDGAGGLLLSPRDMIKLGVLFLNNGKWNGNQIVSEEWVKLSANPYSGNQWMNNWDEHWGMRGYAYSWWTHSFVKADKKIDMYYAAGWGGQYIMVIPDLDMVVAFTGENYTGYRPPFDILKKYILPAVSL